MNKESALCAIYSYHFTADSLVTRRPLKCALTLGNILVAADGRSASGRQAAGSFHEFHPEETCLAPGLQRRTSTARLFEISSCFGNMLLVPELYCQRTVTAAPRLSGGTV
jgi:hypothetical protein